MKKFTEPLIIIISVYTRIPMPMVYWNDNNLKYAFCFLPAAGLIAGAAQAAWAALTCITGISPVFGAAAACAVPLLVTGGIHIDGFSDTMDALSSHAERQKKLEIMDDPHIGAFGVMWIIVYMMIYAASYYEILTYAASESRLIGMLILLTAFPVISRAAAALAISTTAPSKEKGMLYTFMSAANMKAVGAASAAVIIISMFAVACVSPLFAAVSAVLIIMLFMYFRRMALKEFGGISGDLCGWLIQMTELLLTAAAALSLGTVIL